jgi:regulator of sirC expression with transglutaminase-like and TPR domain
MMEGSMDRRAELTLFAHLAARPDGELDLAEAALLIAEAEYPGLDIPLYRERLRALGVEARRRHAGAGPTVSAVDVARGLLYRELGFRGNGEDYYDPRNSFLNDVLDRRAGIPITLGLVLVETLRGAGVSAHGVSFPGHFLVRADAPRGPLWIDPFEGRLLEPTDLRALHARATGVDRDPDPRLLEPATKSQVLIRMLTNLRAIYSARGDRERLRATLERLEVLAPSSELSREIERLGGARGFPTPPGPRALG